MSESIEPAAATADADAATATAADAATATDAAAARLVESSPLDGAHVLLTGGTGFLGQAILERLLADHPTTRVSLLIRRKGNVAGRDRLTTLFRKPVFRSWRERVGEAEANRAIAERVHVVDGGLDHIDSLADDLDIVIHSASTVSFDPPIDEAFATNVGGARVLYDAIARSGSTPHVVHVSTAYVGGTRKGIQPERSLEHAVDWRVEAEAARSARTRVEEASRRPDVLRRLMGTARRAHGKAGPQAVSAATEAARVDWVTKRLVDYGRTRAESLGWTDVYTLTKALAERVAEEQWAEEGGRLSVVRPSIIESALSHPFPGWIDGFKVADPLILAYGRGQLPEFPGLPDSVLDIIPVDFVVNAVLAAAQRPPAPAAPRYVHISSGASNPLPFHRMYGNVHTYFTESPLPADAGDIAVPTWNFPGGRAIERSINRRQIATAAAGRIVSKLPSGSTTRQWQDRIRKAGRDLGSLREFTGLYRAYVQSEIVFDDEQARALHHELPADARRDRGFDVTTIDWDDYFQRIHFPAITTLTRAFANRSKQTPGQQKILPVRSDVVAVFDLEGTVLEWNLVEQYLWLRLAATSKSRLPYELGSLAVSLPKYLGAERRDRGEFIRTFMRRYEGVDVERLRAIVDGPFGDAVRARLLPEALEQIQAHRAAGHRTILVTGTIGAMAAPLEPYFDEVVAGSMHEEHGRLTGYLAAPPLVDEARGAWLRQYAEHNGLDLAHSYGYGDSHADHAWLSLVGNPVAINPDHELYRLAQEGRWPVREWHRSRTAQRSAQRLAQRAAETRSGRTGTDHRSDSTRRSEPRTTAAPSTPMRGERTTGDEIAGRPTAHGV
ncbi:SDR family oxidoreductase [Plantibacter sp. Mn2098]|uniref:SDR family oxidoreductase n=1 Tax=Plantibacter sp. Mn2098 TaxID=3395266 RepID=UPI003BD800D8